MVRDMSKLVVVKSERRQEGKEIFDTIYLQEILAERIWNQHLLLHVGNWHIHSQNLIERLSRLDKRGNVSKAHPLVQLNAGSSRGKTKENRRGTLPTTRQKLVVGKFGKKTRGQGKVRRKDIKTVPPSPCGGLAYPLTESFWELSKAWQVK